MPQYEFLRLVTKPTAQLSYSFTPATAHERTGVSSPDLVVFVNGLGLPQAVWKATIANLEETSPYGLPALLTYDRFGQGQTTDRDPDDEGATDPTHAHDCMSSVRDLRHMITQLLADRLNIQNPDNASLLLVGNSIGCSLIRLYAQEYPGTVSAILFLDSTLTDTDFVSVFPDPDAQSFNQDDLPHGVTAEDLRVARAETRKRFHPDVGSREGLSRRNLYQLLPLAYSPPLNGPGEKGPLITVLGHDFEYFASRTGTDFGIPGEAVQAYLNPHWQRYNEGLAKLTSSERSQGPFQAPGAGHFIQMDNPGFVAEKINELLQKLADK